MNRKLKYRIILFLIVLSTGCTEKIVDDFVIDNSGLICSIVSPGSNLITYKPVEIEIDASDDKLLDHVQIFIDDSTSGDMKLLLPPFKFTYNPTFNEGMDTTIHKIYCMAYDRDGNSKKSNTINIKCPNFLPPHDFSVESTDSSSLKLKWINQATVQQYNIIVEYLTYSGFETKYILTQSQSELTLTDLDVRDDYSYRFYLKAGNYESAKTDTITLKYQRQPFELNNDYVVGIFNVISSSLSSDGTQIALSNGEETIFYDTDTFSELKRINYGGAISFSRVGDFFAVINKDTTRIYNLNDMSFYSFPSPGKEVSNCILLDSQRLLAWNNSAVYLYNAYNQNQFFTIINTGAIRSVDYSPDKNLFVVLKSTGFSTYNIDSPTTIIRSLNLSNAYYLMKIGFSMHGEAIILVYEYSFRIYTIDTFSLLNEQYFNSSGEYTGLISVGIDPNELNIAGTFEKYYEQGVLLAYEGGVQKQFIYDPDAFILFNPQSNKFYAIGKFGRISEYNYSSISVWTVGK